MTRPVTIDLHQLSTTLGGAQEGWGEWMGKYGGAALGGALGSLASGPVGGALGTTAGAFGYDQGGKIGRMIDRGEDRPPPIKQTERFQRR